MLAYENWILGLPEEAKFWRSWLKTDHKTVRLSLRQTDPRLIKQIIDTAGPVIRILDVGAGPLTTLSANWPGRAVVVIPVDALAAEYDLLLHEAGISPPIRTLPIHAERVAEVFPPDYFDAVNCANALDHFYDPIKAVHQMLAVTRPGGVVRVVTRENEGENARYWGLHQWNICMASDDVRIWNLGSVDIQWSQEFSQAVMTTRHLTDYMERKHNPPLLEVCLRNALTPNEG